MRRVGKRVEGVKWYRINPARAARIAGFTGFQGLEIPPELQATYLVQADDGPLPVVAGRTAEELRSLHKQALTMRWRLWHLAEHSLLHHWLKPPPAAKPCR